WVGVTEDQRSAVFVGRDFLPLARQDLPYWSHGSELICSSDLINEQSLPEYVDALAEFNPQVIDGFPSSVEAIARYVRGNYDKRIRPGAVITSAEALTPSARRVVEEAFACPVFDHY